MRINEKEPILHDKVTLRDGGEKMTEKGALNEPFGRCMSCVEPGHHRLLS
jgi:hypothetical protein